MNYKQVDITNFIGKTYKVVKLPYETWDYLSYRLYKDSSYYKVIWQFNNIIDPNDELYKTNQVELVIPQYPSEAINFFKKQ